MKQLLIISIILIFNIAPAIADGPDNIQVSDSIYQPVGGTSNGPDPPKEAELPKRPQLSDESELTDGPEPLIYAELSNGPEPSEERELSHATALVEIPEVVENVEEEENVIEETSEESKRETEAPVVDPIIEKQDSFTPFTKRVLKWILGWFN